VAETLDGAYLQLEDAALQLRDYAARIEADPQALQQADDRLDLIARLKKKYAPSVEELISLQARLADELAELEGRCRSREELEQSLAQARTLMDQRGSNLSAARRRAADKLAKALSTEVHQLAMPHAVVQVAFEPLPEPRSSGCERVEFLFSPNPGETPRPLARVASGGELSRLMLAFKQILPEGEAPSLVFDEVDTGVGGAVAGMIGRKLKNVAAGQQVFCITHLPQVAAWATRHLKVEKQVQDGRTVTKVAERAGPGVIDELARMLAGETVSEAARQHAAELIAQASKI
jgi:DNA repair protein RecN (Recombination protein N)